MADHSSFAVEQTLLQARLGRALAQLKKPAAPVERVAPVDREEINHLRQRLDKAEDGLDDAAKRERDLKQLVTEVNGKLLDARDAFITLENAHVQQIDDLNAEIDRLVAEIARLTKPPPGGPSIVTDNIRAVQASGLHPGSSRFMRAKFDFQVGDLPCEYDDDECMDFKRGATLQVNVGQSSTSRYGMVMGKNMITGASGYVPYSLMEKIEETELPNRRQSRIIGSNFDAMAGQRQRDTARVSRVPSADRLRFRLEEARSTRGSPTGSSSTSPHMSRGGSADPLPAQMTPVAGASADATPKQNLNALKKTLSRSVVQSKISYHSAGGS